MLSKITPEELILFETLRNPTSCTEVLFHNFDDLGNFSETEYSHVRAYQYPFQNYGSLFCEDSSLTAKQNFDIKKGFSDSYILGGRLTGKCEYEENYCQLFNGKRIKFKELINKSASVISLNELTGKLEKSRAFFKDNGNKECLEISLEGGKNIIITENHPLLTDSGWKEARFLNIGDFIATPRKYPINGTANIDPQIAIILGYLLGDGSCSQSQIGITNINKEIIEEVYNLAEYFNCKIREYNLTYWFRAKEKMRSTGGYFNKNNIQKLVLRYGINKLSKNKVIPNEVFTWKNKYISLLLNRLFACDGYIENRSLGITLASEEMIKQIHSLLLRFDIYSIMYHQKKKCNGKYFDAYTLLVASDYNKFLAEIGIKTKDKDRNKVDKISLGDNIPKHFFLNLYKGLEGYLKKYNLRKMKIYDCTRSKWLRIGIQTKNSEILKIARSHIRWNKIKKITNIGIRKTVMVSVPKNNNYISNDIISHNSLIGLIVDVCISFFNKTFNWGVVSSYDALHVRGVMEKILLALENHKILKLLKVHPLRSPCYKVTAENGCLLESVNDNLMGKNPGAQWFQKHVDINWSEESSFLTDKVTNKKLMAQSELGCIDRFSGMTTFPKVSPMGKIFYNLKNINKIINLSSYVNPTWNEEKDEAAILEFGGKNSVGYEVQILGKVVEAGDSVYDVERIRETYRKDIPIKAFEINKNNFYRYKEVIIVDRPSNADSVYVCLDKGEGAAPTEIIVLFKINGIYKYEYNITSFKLSPDEDNEVVDFIVQMIKANVIGIDVTSGGGKAMFSHLTKKYPENVVGVSFNEKIDIDFLKDDKGNNIYSDKGKPQYQQEFIVDWSIQRLKHLFYNKKIQCLMDYKLDQQFDGIIVMRSGQRTVYGSKVANHLHQAFQVFSICDWQTEFKNLQPIQTRKPSLGTIMGNI